MSTITDNTVDTDTEARFRRRSYVFDNLADLERLEILANDPGFRSVCLALPEYGTSTKPSMTSTTGMMLVGAFTVICGGDDRATAELRYHWLRIREMFIAAGIGAPRGVLTAEHWRDFRDTFLAGRLRSGHKAQRSDDRLGEMVARLRTIVRTTAIGQARSMGMLDACEWRPGAHGLWVDIPMERTILGDGLWFREQCSENPPPRPKRSGKKKKSKDRRPVRHTRSKIRRRRVSRGIDTRGKATGYENVIVSVRGREPRRWVVLDVTRAVKAEEMDSFIESMRILLDEVGDSEFLALYDGAMRGEHHTVLRNELGMLTVNKAHGFDGDKWSKMRGTPVGKRVRTVPVAFTASNGESCVKHMWAAGSLLWVVEQGLVSRINVAVAEHHSITRTAVPGGYRWTLDVSVHCAEHGEAHHTQIDPCGMFGTRSLAEQLRILPQNFYEEFGEIYGRRNAAESGMRHLRYIMCNTTRARSMTADRADLDLWLAVLVNNALAWAEHGPQRAGSTTRWNRSGGRRDTEILNTWK
jgi:hypothetical protein